MSLAPDLGPWPLPGGPDIDDTAKNWPDVADDDELACEARGLNQSIAGELLGRPHGPELAREIMAWACETPLDVLSHWTLALTLSDEPIDLILAVDSAYSHVGTSLPGDVAIGAARFRRTGKPLRLEPGFEQTLMPMVRPIVAVTGRWNPFDALCAISGTSDRDTDFHVDGIAVCDLPLFGPTSDKELFAHPFTVGRVWAETLHVRPCDIVGWRVAEVDLCDDDKGGWQW